MKKEFRGCSWLMSDTFWRHIQPLLPRYPRSSHGGRPRANLRQVMARRRRYTPHIRSRGEEKTQRRRGHRPRRWVVERVHSWLNRYRRILVRWDKKAANYGGLLHLVFAHALWQNC